MRVREFWEAKFTVQRPWDPFPLLFHIEGATLEEVAKRLWDRAGKDAAATVNSLRCRSITDFSQQEAAAKMVELLKPIVDATIAAIEEGNDASPAPSE